MNRKDWKHLAFEQNEICRVLERTTNTVSWLRLVAFGFAASFIVAGAVSSLRSFYWFSVICLIAFILLVVYHGRMERRLSRGQGLFHIYNHYARRQDGTWREEDFSHIEAGEAPLTQKEIDLDLYGPGSLYQYLCVAETCGGRQHLRELLGQDAPDYEEIIRRQQATKDLLGRETFHMEFLIALQGLKGKNGVSNQEDTERFVREAEQQASVSGTAVWLRRILAWLLPVVTLGSFVFNARLGIALCIVQFISGLIGNAVFGNHLRAIFEFQQYLSSYKELFTLLDHQEALSAFRKLSRLCECVKFRYNPLGYMLASLFLMWDFHCMDAWVCWKYHYGNQVSFWLSQIAKTETNLSLLTLAKTRAQIVYPEVLAGEEPCVHCTGLTHPLIPEEAAVGNDFSERNGLFVITGSNMSGKTTFMRTLGINLVLMYAGGPVCGISMKGSIMNIRTSMRVSDHIGEGLSTFYAEVLGIRDIVEFVSQEKPMLALIDEIYKGTNSKDRATCAVATAKRLARPHTMVLMTTHDRELCKLSEDREGVKNYHFTEHYEGNRLLFDYRIQPGEAQGSNACHLLGLAGILE